MRGHVGTIVRVGEKSDSRRRKHLRAVNRYFPLQHAQWRSSRCLLPQDSVLVQRLDGDHLVESITAARAEVSSSIDRAKVAAADQVIPVKVTWHPASSLRHWILLSRDALSPGTARDSIAHMKRNHLRNGVDLHGPLAVGIDSHCAKEMTTLARAHRIDSLLGFPWEWHRHGGGVAPHHGHA